MVDIALIGAGRWGKNLVRTFHNIGGSRLRWLVDLDEEALGAISSCYPGLKTTTQLTEALADPKVEALVIATPASTHYALALEALALGKHLFVEKPLATSTQEAKAIYEGAEEAGCMLMVGHVFLHNPAVKAIKEALEKEHLGALHYISMTRTNDGPIRQDVSVAWDLASHDISMMLHWLESDPIEVSARGAEWTRVSAHGEAAHKADTLFATLTFPKDVLVHLHVSWLTPGKVREVTLVGDKGLISFDDTNNAAPLRTQTRASSEARAAALEEWAPLLSSDSPLEIQCRHFVKELDEGRYMQGDALFATRVIRVIEAIEASMASKGAPVRLS